jgi:hypothetical protein
VARNSSSERWGRPSASAGPARCGSTGGGPQGGSAARPWIRRFSPFLRGAGSGAASSVSPAGTEAGRLDAAPTTACSGGSPSTRRAAGQQAGPCAACSHVVGGFPYLGRHQSPPLAAQTPTTRRLSTPTSHNSLELGIKARRSEAQRARRAAAYGIPPFPLRRTIPGGAAVDGSWRGGDAGAREKALATRGKWKGGERGAHASKEKSTAAGGGAPDPSTRRSPAQRESPVESFASTLSKTSSPD